MRFTATSQCFGIQQILLCRTVQPVTDNYPMSTPVTNPGDSCYWLNLSQGDIVKAAILCIGFVSMTALFSMSKQDAKMPDFCDKFKVDALHCSCRSMDGGIEYCVAIRQVADNGAIKTVVNDRITNLTEPIVSVPLQGKFEDLYDLSVFDFRGNKLPSKKEQSEALAREQPLKGQEPVIPDMTSQRHDPFRELPLGASIESEYTLRALFNIKSGEKYRITLGRRSLLTRDGRNFAFQNTEVKIAIP